MPKSSRPKTSSIGPVSSTMTWMKRNEAPRCTRARAAPARPARCARPLPVAHSREHDCQRGVVREKARNAGPPTLILLNRAHDSGVHGQVGQPVAGLFFAAGLKLKHCACSLAPSSGTGRVERSSLCTWRGDSRLRSGHRACLPDALRTSCSSRVVWQRTLSMKHSSPAMWCVSITWAYWPRRWRCPPVCSQTVVPPGRRARAVPAPQGRSRPRSP